MASQSIQHIIVLPKTIKSALFYINNNMTDAHYKEKNDLYHFIAAMLKPPATLQTYKCIFHHIPFYVNVKDNTVEELHYDSASKIEEMKAKAKTSVIKDLIRDLRLRKNKKDPLLPEYQDVSDSITNGYLYRPDQIEGSRENIQKKGKDRGARILDKL